MPPFAPSTPAGPGVSPGMVNPVGATMGLAAQSLASIGHRGDRHATQNAFVNQFENPFGRRLAEIARLAETDPEAAAQQLTEAWGNYYSAAQSWINAGTYNPQNALMARAAQQSLSNPSLMQTVDWIAASLGMSNLRQAGTARPDSLTPSGIPVPGLPGVTVPIALPPINIPLPNVRTFPIPRPLPTTFPVPATKETKETAKETTQQRAQRRATERLEKILGIDLNHDGVIGGSGDEKEEDPWDWLKDALLPGVLGGALNLAGAFLGSGAAKEIAQIQADAANKAAQLQADTAEKAINLQENMYKQNREDIMPWMNTGQTALGRLSYGMGLPASIDTTPFTAGYGPAPAITPTPSPRGQYLAQNATPSMPLQQIASRGIPNFDQIDQIYRR